MARCPRSVAGTPAPAPSHRARYRRHAHRYCRPVPCSRPTRAVRSRRDRRLPSRSAHRRRPTAPPPRSGARAPMPTVRFAPPSTRPQVKLKLAAGAAGRSLIDDAAHAARKRAVADTIEHDLRHRALAIGTLRARFVIDRGGQAFARTGGIVVRSGRREERRRGGGGDTRRQRCGSRNGVGDPGGHLECEIAQQRGGRRFRWHRGDGGRGRLRYARSAEQQRGEGEQPRTGKAMTEPGHPGAAVRFEILGTG